MGEKRTDKYRDLGDVGAVGIEFVLSLAVGYYAGRWLDTRFFGGHGWATGIGSILGVITAFKAIFDAAKRAQRRLERLEAEEREEQRFAASTGRNRDGRSAQDPPRDSRRDAQDDG